MSTETRTETTKAARRLARSAAVRAKRRTMSDRDGLLRPADVERQIWGAICSAGQRGGDREERAELTARLAIVAAETIDRIRSDRPSGRLRRSDVETIGAQVADAVERTRRDYRREIGAELPRDTHLDPEAGTADLIHAAESAALRRTRAHNRTMGKVGPDPAEPWLRGAVADCRAGDRALLLTATMPMVTAAEWAPVERTKSAADFRNRLAMVERTIRDQVAKRPDKAAERIAGLCSHLADEPDSFDPIAALLRWVGPAPDKAARALPLPDRGTDPAETIGAVRSRKLKRLPSRRPAPIELPVPVPSPVRLAPVEPDQVERARVAKRRRREARQWAEANRAKLTRIAKRRARLRREAEARETTQRTGRVHPTTGRPMSGR